MRWLINVRRTSLWVPTAGPQLDAYLSEADVLLYGGQAAGGKTDLGLGLAFTQHERSLIIRRQYTDMKGITDPRQADQWHGQGLQRLPAPTPDDRQQRKSSISAP